MDENIDKYIGMSEILDKMLFLGDAVTSQNLETLEENNIKVIINCTKNVPCKYDKDFDYYRFKLNDFAHEEISEYFEKSYKIIDKNIVEKRPVYVHCGSGVSRSGTIVISYIMKKKKMGFLEALKFVKLKRDVVCPNMGFWRQLQKYEDKISEKE